MILSRDPVSRLLAVMLALCAIPSFGWAGAKPPVDPNTPEGRLLEKIQAESDLSKRMVLLELFPELFPALLGGGIRLERTASSLPSGRKTG